MMSFSRKPHVLIVIRQFFPRAAGAETQALRQARSYIALGYRATVVTARHDKTLPAEDTVEGVPVTRLSTSRARFLGSIIFLAALAYFLISRSRQYDAVLVFHLKQAAALSCLLCPFLGKRVIVSDQAAGSMGDVEMLGKTPLGWFVMRCVKKAGGFISGASEITQELLRIGVDRAKIHFVPNGIPMEQFSNPVDRNSAREALALPRGAFVALNVGRHTYQKDVKTILEGWRMFSAESPGAILVLVGDGDERGALEKFAAENGRGTMSPITMPPRMSLSRQASLRARTSHLARRWPPDCLS